MTVSIEIMYCLVKSDALKFGWRVTYSKISEEPAASIFRAEEWSVELSLFVGSHPQISLIISVPNSITSTKIVVQIDRAEHITTYSIYTPFLINPLPETALQAGMVFITYQKQLKAKINK